MSHTTHVKHTGYQVNIIHHEIMFQVTINNIVQYICQCRIRPPNRAGNTDLRGTDTISGDGCVGRLTAAVPLELVQKCGRASGVRTGCSNTTADPRRTAPTAITAAIHRILIAHVRHRIAPFRCRSQTQPRSEAVAGRSYRIESVRRAIGLRGLPPSAPTSNPTGFRLGSSSYRYQPLLVSYIM